MTESSARFLLEVLRALQSREGVQGYSEMLSRVKSAVLK